MHVVIMGCGRVGSSLARVLEERGHSVAVIDRDEASFRRLGTRFEGARIKGIGFDRRTLLDAGIEQAGAFAAVSSGDNSNILSARVARETYGVPHVVARIYDPGRAEIYQRLGIPTIATVRWASDQVLRAILPTTSSNLFTDPSGQISMLEVVPHRSWIGRPLSQIEDLTGARVGYLSQGGKSVFPTDGQVYDADAALVLLAPTSRLSDIEQFLLAPGDDMRELNNDQVRKDELHKGEPGEAR